MTSSATLRQVAEQAGVAVPTASRVLNGDPTVRVRDETRQRVQKAAERLGYVPNSVARSLRGSRTGSIGLMMHGLDSPINAEVLTGAQSRCSAAGYVTLLADAGDLERNRSQLRSFLARGRLDGVILHSGFGPGDELVEQIASSLPAVLINADRGRAAPSVCLDDEAAGAIAAQHLVDLGHRRVAYIGGMAGSPSSVRRERGCRRILSESGVDAETINADWTASGGAIATRALLRTSRNRPTALVVANAVTAAGVLDELRTSGISVPREMSVVGIHDPWFVPYLAVALTAVHMPLFDLGSAAAGMLIDRIETDAKVGDLFIADPSPELIIRTSTGAPPAGLI